jgi:hypothetical protein
MDTKNIQFLIEILGKLDDNQAKFGTDIKAWKEKMDAKTEAIRRETVAIRAETKARREMRNASRKETAAVIEPETEVKTMACQEMAAHQEEEEPNSAERKPEAAEQREIPVDDTDNAGRRTKEEKTQGPKTGRGAPPPETENFDKRELRTPEKTGRRPQWVEPPWESNMTPEGNTPQDAPSRDSGTTQERHREEESCSGS